MILNLLRVEELRVEDMMKRSFAEFHMQKDAQERKLEMEQLEKKLQDIKELDCTFCSEDLKSYFRVCRELSELTRAVQVMQKRGYFYPSHQASDSFFSFLTSNGFYTMGLFAHKIVERASEVY